VPRNLPYPHSTRTYHRTQRAAAESTSSSEDPIDADTNQRHPAAEPEPRQPSLQGCRRVHCHKTQHTAVHASRAGRSLLHRHSGRHLRPASDLRERSATCL
ncbi:hypothetical protein ANCDUO_24342, partial [Ancylostoma duodenale]